MVESKRPGPSGLGWGKVGRFLTGSSGFSCLLGREGPDRATKPHGGRPGPVPSHKNHHFLMGIPPFTPA